MWDANGEVKPEFAPDEDNSEDEPPVVKEVKIIEELQPLFPLFL